MRRQGEPSVQITHTRVPTEDEFTEIAHGRPFEYQDVDRYEDYVPDLAQAGTCLLLAMDTDSQNRPFFLQCLYRIVWEVVRGPSLPNPWSCFSQSGAVQEVIALLDMAAASEDSMIISWVERSRHLLEQPEQADHADWYYDYAREGAAERSRREGVARKRRRYQQNEKL